MELNLIGKKPILVFHRDLLFLVYINDLTDNISSQLRLFADDSSLFTREGVQQTRDKLVKLMI